MLDKVGGTGRGELYGLGDTIKPTKQKKRRKQSLKQAPLKAKVSQVFLVQHATS